MKFLFLFLFSTLLLSADFSLEELKGLTGADFLLPKYHENLTGKELQDYLNLESSFSGLKRMTKAEWEAIPINKSKISKFDDIRSMDLSYNMPEVKSQGYKGACTPWAAGYYLKSYYENKERGKSSMNEMSPAFIYNHKNGKAQSPCETNGGISFADTANFLITKGIASWNKMPYDGTAFVCPEPDANQISDAWQYRNDGFERIIGIDSFRTELAKGNPVLIGIVVSVYFSRASLGWAQSSWGRENPGAWQEGEILETMPLGRTQIDCSDTNPCTGDFDGLTCVRGKCEEVGGHALIITGYNKDEDTFTIVNSWGTDWGTDGYLKIKTNVLERMMYNYQGLLGYIYIDHIDDTCESNCSVIGEKTCSNSVVEICEKSTRGCLKKTRKEICGSDFTCSSGECIERSNGNGNGNINNGGCDISNSLFDTNSNIKLLLMLFLFSLLFIRRKKNI